MYAKTVTVLVAQAVLILNVYFYLVSENYGTLFFLIYEQILYFSSFGCKIFLSWDENFISNAIFSNLRMLEFIIIS